MNSVVLKVSKESEEIFSPDESFVVLDESGNQQATIPTESPAGQLSMLAHAGDSLDGLHTRYRVAVAHGLLVATTQDTKSSESKLRTTNRLVAVDLKTGKQRWSKAMAPDLSATLIGEGNGGFLAINDGTFEKPPRIVRFAPADGSMTPVSRPYAQESAEDPITSMNYTGFTWEGTACTGWTSIPTPRFSR